MRLAEAAKQLMEAARQDEAFEVINMSKPKSWLKSQRNRKRETTTGYLVEGGQQSQLVLVYPKSISFHVLAHFL